MSPYGSIYCTYRAEVAIPDDVFEAFGDTREYEQVSYAAGRAVEVTGQDSYSKVIEWGEAPTRRQCEDFINHWHNWILQWKGRL